MESPLRYFSNLTFPQILYNLLIEESTILQTVQVMKLSEKEGCGMFVLLLFLMIWICNFTGQEFLIRGGFYFFVFL
jgi:hypothetical protein